MQPDTFLYFRDSIGRIKLTAGDVFFECLSHVKCSGGRAECFGPFGNLFKQVDRLTTNHSHGLTSVFSVPGSVDMSRSLRPSGVGLELLVILGSPYVSFFAAGPGTVFSFSVEPPASSCVNPMPVVGSAQWRSQADFSPPHWLL